MAMLHTGLMVGIRLQTLYNNNYGDKTECLCKNDAIGRKNWIKAGGILGLAILSARATRMPLATILTAMPFLIKLLRQAENEQMQAGGTVCAMTKEEAALILGYRYSGK